MSEMLKIENIRKVFNPGTINEKVALDGVNLTLEEGEFVTVIGGNGAGKSTMMNMLYGLLQPTSGKILIRGKIDNTECRSRCMAGRFRKNLYRRRGCDKVIRASQGTISGTCVPGPDDRYGYHNVH